MGYPAALTPGGRGTRGFWPGRRSRRLRRDGAAGSGGLQRLRKYFVRVGIGAADSVGRKFLRQSLVGRIILLLCRPGPGAVRAVSSYGAAWALVHPDQLVPR